MAATSILTGAMAFSQSEAMKQQGAYQKEMYDTNARLAGYQAEDAIRRGNQEAINYKTQAKKTIGAQRAALAASGVDISDGSALDIQQETAAQGAEGALQIKNNAWREAWGYRVQANQYSAQGYMAKSAADFQAKNTLLTGYAQIGSGALGVAKGGM